ncbi:hypothetical protein EDB84DRAFT_938171 [Lactarius hengduanensis]|nr:hypothetical protein EDB84DRAFT_938171 [Lactarius hengduanensis]
MQLSHGLVSPLSSALPVGFAFDFCAHGSVLLLQGCALPFRSPPRAAHRVRPRSPLEGCLGIEIIGGYVTVFLSREFFLNAIGSLPVRGRIVMLSGQAPPPPVHIRWVLFLYAIGSDCQHRPCAGIFHALRHRVWFLATARYHHVTARASIRLSGSLGASCHVHGHP